MLLRNIIIVKNALMLIIIWGVVLPPVFAQVPVKNWEAASLAECLETALENNRRRQISKFAVIMAEARHQQALAGYWPQVSLNGGYQIMDDPKNFIFPASSFNLPMGGGMPVTIPEQDIKLMDRESYNASVNAKWLLYDGGMRKGHQEQGKGYVEMMKQESRRTDLEIRDSVKRLYFGSVLASRLHEIGKHTLIRMETTLDLTETMYKQGSGRIKKTDWLDNKVMVETIRSMVALLEKNELSSQAALANTMGLPWDTSVRPADREMKFSHFTGDLNGLVSAAYQFNPDWGKIEAGIRAAEGAVLTARSGYLPKLAVTGDLHRWWNDYDTGYATDQNKEGWTLGLGIEIPVFNGFMTKHRLAEARARVEQMKEEQFLFKEGVGLRIKDIFLSLQAAEKSYQATKKAVTAARENRDLNIRAYQHGLAKTEKVIRAQLMASLMSAQHCKAWYDHVALESQLNLVVGTEVLDRMNINE